MINTRPEEWEGLKNEVNSNLNRIKELGRLIGKEHFYLPGHNTPYKTIQEYNRDVPERPIHGKALSADKTKLCIELSELVWDIVSGPKRKLYGQDVYAYEREPFVEYGASFYDCGDYLTFKFIA